VKFETAPAFDADLGRLKPEHAVEFKKVVADRFVPACDACAEDPSRPWPASLRVMPVRSSRGVFVFEMTWSFASPNGRATFELLTVDGELRVRWRRVGDHDVFKKRVGVNERRKTTPCVRCGRVLDEVMPHDSHNQPDGGVVFVAHGNYGSKVFDQGLMDREFLEVIVCDECLTRLAAQGSVLRVRHMVHEERVADEWEA
jgi:hypothetical protein